MRFHFQESKSTINDDEEDNRENSCYYNGCKRNANCNCEFCIASINATLDLVPNSSLTKFSSSKPNFNTYSPITFDSSVFNTPRNPSSCITPPVSPVVKSSAKSNQVQRMEMKNEGKKRFFYSGVGVLNVVIVLGFLLLADFVLSRAVSVIYQPSLSSDLVKRVGEKCHEIHDLNGKLRFLQKELGNVVHGRVSNCSFNDSSWEVSQDGLLLNSRCKLYKSAMEEVTIWGWPLQTAGMITTGMSVRTLTILSGRVTEWKDGQVSYLIRKANTSWIQPEWGASVLQLDPNTWVLEYQRSSIVDGKGLFSAATELFKYRISRNIGKMKKNLWLFALSFEDNGSYNWFTTTNYESKTPT
ncbi:uncharacterized protein LOC131636876 [Vicia villosa]|uniref:uncharacterized protein LOC131636876 n=1 Tax=Vicia villosa TaxID=3911 RepID=UPI00273CCF51|nr:uncharacterized protein LOC131636876 [Vicia villosa]